MALGVCSLALTGCSGGTDLASEAAREAGSLRLPLSSTLEGVRYQLDGTFEVSGADSLLIRTADHSAGATSIQQTLAAGSYALQLQSGYRLLAEREGTLQPVAARPLSPLVQPFDIHADSTTSVSFRFELDAGVLEFGIGQLAVNIELEAAPREIALRRLDVPASSLTLNPRTAVLYATVRSDQRAYANQLVTIDPRTPSVVDAVTLGSDPDAAAISDDGSTLWVGLHGESALRRVDVSGASPQPQTQYALPPTEFDALGAARDIVVLPGTNDSVAVSLHVDGDDPFNPIFVGAALLDAGVPRRAQTPARTRASLLTAGPPGYLFGSNHAIQGGGFSVLAVGADGLSERAQREDLVSDLYTGTIHYAGGLVFAENGEVIAVRDPGAPALAGRLPATGPLVPAPDAGRVWMLTPESSEGKFLESFLELDATSFSILHDDSMEGTRIVNHHQLVRLADGGFAFLANDDQGPAIFFFDQPR